MERNIKGSIKAITIDGWSGCLYLPPQYENEKDRRFSAAYLNGGQGLEDEIGEFMEVLEPEFDKGLEPFVIIGNKSEDWNADYAPWPASAVFGKEGFAGLADEYLERLMRRVKPWIDRNYRTKPEPENTAITGYSLGGLAALYAVYRYECFGRAASLSGSLWFEGFDRFLQENSPVNRDLILYLSLGKKEGKSRNKQMRTITAVTQAAEEKLSGELVNRPVLVWNEGGHFDGIAERWVSAMRYLFAKKLSKNEKLDAVDSFIRPGKPGIDGKEGVEPVGEQEIRGIFDSHAHYDDKAFDEDREELLRNLKEKGMSGVVNISSSLDSVRRSIALAEKYPFIYAAVGIHPSETEELTEEKFEWLKEMLLSDKVVAVGEIGLDYYWDTAAKETQKKWFERQLYAASEMDLPVVIHSRDAAQDTLDMMKAAKADAESRGKRLTGVIHCFSYGPEMAREYLKMGFYIGIGGVLTFKNARKLKEAAAEVPLERILLETDCPYLAPEPFRGKRNCSLYLPYVVSALAQLKGVGEGQVIRATRENAERMYGL